MPAGLAERACRGPEMPARSGDDGVPRAKAADPPGCLALAWCVSKFDLKKRFTGGYLSMQRGAR
jgi:hypothetical protein